MLAHPIAQHIEQWPLSRFVPYARNPRKNDHVVDRMAASIPEFGFKVPMLARAASEPTVIHVEYIDAITKQVVGGFRAQLGHPDRRTAIGESATQMLPMMVARPFATGRDR